MRGNNSMKLQRGAKNNASNSSQRIKRSLIKKKYAESSESEENSDDNYEPITKKFRTTRQKIKLDVSPVSQRDKVNNVKDNGLGIAKDECRNDLVDFGLVSRPNLSESESSDEEIRIADLKESLKANNINEVKKEDMSKMDIGKDHKADVKSVCNNPVNTEKHGKGKTKDHTALGVEIVEPLSADVKPSKTTLKSDIADNKNAKVQVDNTEIDRKSKRARDSAIKNADSKTPDQSVSKNKQIKEKKPSRGRKARNEVPARVKQSNVEKTTTARTPEQTTSKQRSKKQQNFKISKDFEKGKAVDPYNSDDLMDCNPGPSRQKREAPSDSSEDDDSENDWQDVHEADVSKSVHDSPKKKSKNQIDVKDVAISLNVKSIHKSKSEKNKELYLKYIERTMRKFHLDLQENKHKLHLLCLVARTMFLNKQCNSNNLKAVCLSLVPFNITKVPKSKWDTQQVKRLVNWFQSGIPETENLIPLCSEEAESLRNITKVQVFVALLRALGFLTRIITSLQPLSPKVSTLFRLNRKDDKKTEINKSHTKPDNLTQHPKTNLKPGNKVDSSAERNAQAKPTASKKNLKTAISPYFDKKGAMLTGDRSKTEGIKTPLAKTKKQQSNKQDKTKTKSNIKNSEKATPTCSTSKLRTSSRPCSKRKRISFAESEGESGIESEIDHSNEVVHLDEANQSESDSDFVRTPRRSLSAKLSAKAKNNTQSPAKKTKLANRKSPSKPYESKLVEKIDDDEEFERTSKPLARKRSNNNKSSPEPVRVMSSDTDIDEPKKRTKKQTQTKIGCDLWVEVYLISSKKWICIELNGNTIEDAKKCEKMATQPLQYVIGIDNDNAIKDVTCRYAANFLTKTRKLRIDREWWAATLRPYETRNKKMEEIEDTQLRVDLLRLPFPATIAEFKNHPLYVVEGDLLKFEAIYPEAPAILGYIRGKAIYSRECVHVLHTRENWLKEARVVKKGEEAYKIAKGRPKRSTPVHERDKVKIDLFGHWQTEVYQPPPVKDGKVPRNEYGNIELFKKCMLPAGAVHIPIQGIQKVAKKLNIDAAPAMMGWDFHSGGAHPIIEGVVVAEEFEEKLLDAWQREEEEATRKKKEKKIQKICDRWKMLVKGLLVRERIRRKYDFREHEEIDRKISAKDDQSASTDISVSWPLNKMEGTTSLNEKGHCHIFPKSSHKQDKITGEWTKSCSCGLTMPFEKL